METYCVSWKSHQNAPSVSQPSHPAASRPRRAPPSRCKRLASTNASTGSKSSQRFFSAFHSTLLDSVVQRSFILEQTIHHRDFEPTGAIELLGTLDMLDIVTKVSPFVTTVVLEFYSNLTKGMGDPTSPDFRTVYVRGHRSRPC